MEARRETDAQEEGRDASVRESSWADGTPGHPYEVCSADSRRALGPCSLTCNIYVLRKVLGDDDGSYIETLPKRGYRFVAPVRQSPLPAASLVIEEHTRTHVVIEETETSGWTLTPKRAAAAAILASLAAGALYLSQRRGEGPAVKSLAVLPLKNLAGGAEARHLELGIADNIIGRVSEISGLTVRLTGAVRKYLDSRTEPLLAARELKVDMVLDGTLQLAEGRIRLNLNLLRTSSGASPGRGGSRSSRTGSCRTAMHLGQVAVPAINQKAARGRAGRIFRYSRRNADRRWVAVLTATRLRVVETPDFRQYAWSCRERALTSGVMDLKRSRLAPQVCDFEPTTLRLTATISA